MSFLYGEFLILITPLEVYISPFQACLVGITQSNISTPTETALIISTGVPSPIKYLGFSTGIIGINDSRTKALSSAGSPTDSHPIANPSKLISVNFSRFSVLKSSYMPP